MGPNPTVAPDLLWPLAAPTARPITPYWAGPNGINVLLWTAFSAIVLSIAAYLLVVDVREQLRRGSPES
ncbi:hypothetical protein [Halobellus sp. EA9]|uniref:hypothetical protein n=1 Tax=Halobellus sp. EA9 TaxID=3421647 RepID=UPI003EBA27D0